MSEVTRILKTVEDGDPTASEQLLPLVYEELRKLAAVKLANERPGHTLQATALVHEAYIRLTGNDVDILWNSQGHFFAAAAEAMRRILVEKARQKKTQKRGGDMQRQELRDVANIEEEPPEDLLYLDAALDRLREKDASKAELVQLRYFAGLTLPQAAAVLVIAQSTAEKHWSFAKCWLRSETRRIADEEA